MDAYFAHSAFIMNARIGLLLFLMPTAMVVGGSGLNEAFAAVNTGEVEWPGRQPFRRMLYPHIPDGLQLLRLSAIQSWTHCTSKVWAGSEVEVEVEHEVEYDHLKLRKGFNAPLLSNACHW
jgi:hypothetical protein